MRNLTSNLGRKGLDASCVRRDNDARRRLLSMREESHKGIAERASSFSSA